VVNTIGEENAIVKMPTGSGKTLVAAEIIKRRLADGHSKQKKALFLVPTCDLVEQQAAALRAWTDRRVAEYKGGAVPPASADDFDILVSTPMAFLTRMQRGSDTFSWPTFCVCVFDEVHHVLKEHPYRRLALDIKSNVATSALQVIGLSASLTYAVSPSGVRDTLLRISGELRLAKMETVNEEELRAGGFVPQALGKNVERAFEHEVPEGVVSESQRKPHLMKNVFMDRVKSGNATPFSQLIWRVVSLLEAEAAVVLPTGTRHGFVSPLSESKLAAWEDYAHKLAAQIQNPAASAISWHLERWYVALRILVQTWEEDEPLVLEWLADGVSEDAMVDKAEEGSMCALHPEPHWPSALHCAIREVQELASNEFNRMKVSCLKDQLHKKQKHFGNSFRCIIFVQQRVAAYVLASFVNRTCGYVSTDASQHKKLRAGYVTAKNSRITPSITMSSAGASDAIKKFRSGELNVLVATSVIEEGFDVPAANVVISFNPLKDSVELQQRFGRARQENSHIVVMAERSDRPVTLLDRVRQQQDEIIEPFEPLDAAKKHDTAKDVAAQLSRERGAASMLKAALQGEKPLAALNLYVKKTKAYLGESYEKTDDGSWACSWHYSSCLRSARTSCTGATKKKAKEGACIDLLRELSKLSGQ
jgi:ERCC4-related helicase